jgi:hypothetical protein
MGLPEDQNGNSGQNGNPGSIGKRRDMNTGRFVGAAIAVWIIRTAMNATFYGLVVGPRFEQVAAAHPRMFRTVIPAYVIADLIFAVVFTVLFTMVAGPLVP